MFAGYYLKKEIKDKVLGLKKIGRDTQDYLLNNKIELDKLKIFKRTITHPVKKYIARLMGHSGSSIKQCSLRAIKACGNRKEMGLRALIDYLNSSSPDKKILYVTSAPTYNLLKASIYLRQAGYKTILLLETNLTFLSFMEEYFDVVYVFDSVYSLAHILKKAKPYILHVQGISGISNHLVILAKFLSKCKIVFNFYDIPSTAIAQEDIESLWNKQEVKTDLFSEKFAIENADGVIFNYSIKVAERLKERYQPHCPMLEFHSYPCDEFMSNNSSKYSDKDARIHLVQAGMVAQSNLPKKFNKDGSYYGLIEILSQQGIYFDIYTTARKIHRDYKDYIQIAKKNHFFNIYARLPLYQAVKELSKYDFGSLIMTYDDKEDIIYKRKVYIEEHKGMKVPDRFFTYLEAGLPILVRDDLKYTAKLVKEYEIGIIIGRKEMGNLTQVINSYDREKLKTNVIKARQDMSMKKNITRLINFYEQVVKDNYESKI